MSELTVGVAVCGWQVKASYRFDISPDEGGAAQSWVHTAQHATTHTAQLDTRLLRTRGEAHVRAELVCARLSRLVARSLCGAANSVRICDFTPASGALAVLTVVPCVTPCVCVRVAADRPEAGRGRGAVVRRR